ncbi:MAG: hypothetical protein QW794_08010 [Thermosphaera sp.]
MSRQVSVRLSQEFYDRLVSIATRKYGKVKGGLSKVLVEAIEEYLKRWESENRADTKQSC